MSDTETVASENYQSEGGYSIYDKNTNTNIPCYEVKNLVGLES